jgi:hypothetical protein
MEYILFIHNNANSVASDEQWDWFFDAAKNSGLFQGGSEISNPIQLGSKKVSEITAHIDGFMRFESNDINSVLSVLEMHPVAIHGGTLELCEMPRTD